MSNCDAECQHRLLIQHEKFMHEEVMASQELERVKLEIELEKLQVQALALQKGVAGGESQGGLMDVKGLSQIQVANVMVHLNDFTVTLEVKTQDGHCARGPGDK
ncbi:hypothetical protein EDD15DRAFT_2200375 [Pisolithus albus]|nr:hypothetical protein EDD15DRAFT_2200375 [Pisolithus albus]